MHTNGQVDLVPADAGPPALELLEDLRGRPAVVTGAARGIGEAIAKWLIGAGADVTVIDKDPDALRTPSAPRTARSSRPTSTPRTWPAWPTS